MAVSFAMRRGVTTLLSAMRTVMKNCPALQRDEPRRGGGDPRPTETTPDASADNINGSEKERKVTHVHGKPLRPCGPAPPTRRSSCYSQVLIHPPPISAAWDLQSHAMEYQDFQPEKIYRLIALTWASRIQALAGLRIRKPAPQLRRITIHRSVSEGRP